MTGERGVGLHHLVEAAADRHPDALAVTDGHCDLSFAELDSRANQLARYLRANGVGPGAIVGVELPRRPSLVPALLGILKAGASYLPLDLRHPANRRRFAIEDAGAATVIDEAVLERAAGAPTERFDEAAPLLAYVIYTSGSTGSPKGVAVPHSAAVSLLRAMDEWIDGGPGDTWLAVTTIAFDISVYELFGSLARGMTVWLDDLSEGGLFDTALATGVPITHFQATPSLLGALLVDERSTGGLARLRTLISTGEALPPTLAAALRGATSARILNAYGPTETTIWATVWELPDEVPDRIPIGRPLANTSVAIDDDGELVVAGAGIALGYLGRPALTADRFVPDDLGSTPGARAYRTGDVAAIRVDGTIDYFGRRDDQVKVRGMRIELMEVDAAIAEVDGVQDAVVTAESDAAQETRLVAHLVAEPGVTFSIAALRRALRDKLPDPMIPARLVIHEELPRQPSGKRDRAALGGRAQPRSASEHQLHVVVRNERGQYSMWPAHRSLPAGWQRIGRASSRAACSTEIERLWTDIRT